MKKIGIGLAIFVIVLAAAYIGVSWYFASQVIVFQAVPISANDPDAEPEDIDWTPDWDIDPPAEAIQVMNGDIVLAADFYDNPADAGCAVVYLHGLSGSRLQIGIFGPMFYELGCDVFAYNARAHYDSSPGYLTYGYYEKDDALAAINWVVERTALDTSQIGLFGQSYGASTALQVLSLEPDFAFVIADSPYQDMNTIIKDRANDNFGSWINLIVPGALQVAEFRADFEVDDVSAMNAVQGVNTPIFLIHSLQDDFTFPAHSEAIYAAANPDTTRLWLTDWNAEHARSIFVDEEAYIAQIYAFLAEFAPTFGNQASRG